MARTRLRVTGTVQGVGFRPFVYRHAVALGLSGTVCNDSAGVLIDVEGADEAIVELTRALTEDAPPLARVGRVTVERVEARGTSNGFCIVETDDSGAPDVPVSVDSATCAECLAEVDDPLDRRYRYPFTNCTNCGPRYTIVERVPYDRVATTMREFRMCAECRSEFDDPANRRFHAQPNACPVCGPRLTWHAVDGAPLEHGDPALVAALAALREGAIIAVKGIGGYHLVVDATDARAVSELRRRKARDDKPFAVMVADRDAARAVCALSANAMAALVSPARPIVLAPRVATADVADEVAPGSPDLGVFLPYSPLHHLLLAGVGRPLVMTSGNHSDEPIAHDDDDAIARLGPMVDGVLTHDRAIHIRCDDSVARAAGHRVQLLRRSRGYAPDPVPLPFPQARSVLAVGGELKSTIAVTRGDDVVASHHIGDLEHLATYRSFLQAVDHLPALYGVRPDVVAHDLHPEYLSTKFALDLALPTMGVQHHHAHVAACMVEHGRVEPVLGLAFDGLGYGPDGTLWGGEFLVAGFDGFTRVGHLRAVSMPGGARAIREPWRMAAVWAHAAGIGAEWARESIAAATVEAVLDVAATGHSPVTTSMGRVFDAVAVLLGGRLRVSYEAQAAIELEALARRVDRAEASAYRGVVDISTEEGMLVLDPAPLIERVFADHAGGTTGAVIAAAFHEAIGRAAADVAIELARADGIDAVALTGGVFQNVRLTEVVESELGRAGLRVLVHERIPPNDGGLSIGQAAVAAFADRDPSPGSAPRRNGAQHTHLQA